MVPLISTLLACRKGVVASNQDIDLPRGPSLYYVSIYLDFFWPIHPTSAKTDSFLTQPTQAFCWRNIEMILGLEWSLWENSHWPLNSFFAQTVANYRVYMSSSLLFGSWITWSVSSWEETKVQNFGSFFLWLSFSRSQVFNFFRWKHHYLSENIAIHSNDDLFT